jgi:hypothetical protein
MSLIIDLASLKRRHPVYVRVVFYVVVYCVFMIFLFFQKNTFQEDMVAAIEKTGNLKIEHLYREPHENRGVVCGYYTTDEVKHISEKRYFIYVDHYSVFQPLQYIVFLNSKTALTREHKKYCEHNDGGFWPDWNDNELQNELQNYGASSSNTLNSIHLTPSPRA